MSDRFDGIKNLATSIVCQELCVEFIDVRPFKKKVIIKN